MKRETIKTIKNPVAAVTSAAEVPDIDVFVGYYRWGGGAVTKDAPGAGSKRQTIQEFVAFLYEFWREEPAMVQRLDQALKQRYGPQ